MVKYENISRTLSTTVTLDDLNILFLSLTPDHFLLLPWLQGLMANQVLSCHPDSVKSVAHTPTAWSWYQDDWCLTTPWVDSVEVAAVSKSKQ